MITFESQKQYNFVKQGLPPKLWTSPAATKIFPPTRLLKQGEIDLSVWLHCFVNWNILHFFLPFLMCKWCCNPLALYVPIYLIYLFACLCTPHMQ